MCSILSSSLPDPGHQFSRNLHQGNVGYSRFYSIDSYLQWCCCHTSSTAASHFHHSDKWTLILAPVPSLTVSLGYSCHLSESQLPCLSGWDSDIHPCDFGKNSTKLVIISALRWPYCWCCWQVSHLCPREGTEAMQSCWAGRMGMYRCLGSGIGTIPITIIHSPLS